MTGKFMAKAGAALRWGLQRQHRTMATTRCVSPPLVATQRRATRPMVVGEHTVPRANGPPANLATLCETLDGFRDRFPGAVIDRYLEKIPDISATAHVCAGAVIAGDVVLAGGASVWYNAVLRADMNYIHVGENSNIQDNACVHLGDNDPTVIGSHVVVGHGAILHGCCVGDRCLIGIRAVVLDGANVGEGSIIAAGSVVPAGTVIPPDSLVMGTPGKVVKQFSPNKQDHHRMLAEKYARLAYNYRTA